MGTQRSPVQEYWGPMEGLSGARRRRVSEYLVIQLYVPRDTRETLGPGEHFVLLKLHLIFLTWVRNGFAWWRWIGMGAS